MRAGPFGTVDDADRRLDAVCLVSAAGMLSAVGARGAARFLDARKAVFFYGWVIDGRVYGPGARVPWAPRLAWRRRPRGDIIEESANTLVVLAPADSQAGGELVVLNWADDFVDSSGGYYINRGFPQINVHGN